MTYYELALDEDGEPIPVPDRVKGWRVKRGGDGRGRPSLVHARGSQRGKPLVLKVDATHGDLFAAAGPGRYRLEAVDENWKRVEEVPIACTGPLSADDDASDFDAGPDLVGGAVERTMTSEQVICHLVTKQSQVFEKTLGQLSTVMSAVAEVVNAASNAGITSRVLPPAPPAPVEREEPEPEDDEEDDTDDEPAEQGSKLSEMMRLVIKETVDSVVQLIFAKVTANGGTHIGGIPIEALTDWSKAAPGAVQTPAASYAAPPPPPRYQEPTPPAEAAMSELFVVSAPANVDGAARPSTSWSHTSPPDSLAPQDASGVAGNSADPAPAVVSPAPPATPTISVPVPPNIIAHPAATTHAVATDNQPAASVGAGAAPSRNASLGAALATQAAGSGLPARGLLGSPDNMSEILTGHVVQIWQALSVPERVRAGQLIARLSADERAGWFAELAALPVPDAIARARAVIHGPPTSPPTPLIPATPPQRGST